MSVLRLATLSLSALAMGCANLNGPTSSDLATALDLQTPSQWQAALPHNGQLTDLSQWWQRLGDPLLVELIEAAQAASPNVSAAQSRIAQARATGVAADAASRPTLDASASATRSVTQPNVPAGTTLQAGLQAAWEIDLFGGNRAASQAARVRIDASQALWHDARVSVAAEVANQYIGLRACDLQLGLARADAASRQETSRLSALTTRAGFTAPALDALARASAAEASNRTVQQRALCDVAVKALVALTAVSEPEFRRKWAIAPVNIAYSATILVASVPAQALSQRPDIFSAQQDVAAASFDIGASEAQRYPRLSLNGSVGVLNVASGGFTTDLTTWSIGPLALSVPLFDAGRRVANVDAAKARYADAQVQLKGRVRLAVREVEEALVNLQSVTDRSADTQIATDGYRASFKATQARYQSGLASLPELEDARRTSLNADTVQLTLQRDRMLGWVALYRAVGGGWQVSANSSAAAKSSTTPTSP